MMDRDETSTYDIAHVLGSLMSIALLAACGGSAKPSASTPASASRPYGYEFAPDSVAIVAAEPAGADALPTGPGGRLFPTAIQNLVRAHFGEIAACYDEGRKRNPSLKGKVTVKYVIGEDGLTKEAADQGSTLPDKAVVDCVVGKFRACKYQESHGGQVTVVYPIEFTP
jgi:hypothetical protein